jgi:hypothetical protein
MQNKEFEGLEPLSDLEEYREGQNITSRRMVLGVYVRVPTNVRLSLTEVPTICGPTAYHTT